MVIALGVQWYCQITHDQQKGMIPHDVTLNRNCWLAALCVYFPLICECSVYECFVYGECFVYECAHDFKFMVSWIHRYSLTWFTSASKHLVSKVCGYVWPGYPKSSTSASKHLLSCVWLQETGTRTCCNTRVHSDLRVCGKQISPQWERDCCDIY